MTKWTTTAPTEPGWYWVRYLNDLGVGEGAAPTLVEKWTGRQPGLWATDPHNAEHLSSVSIRVDQWEIDQWTERRHVEWQGPVRPEE